MLSSINHPVVRRLNAFVNAGVVLLVLLGLFIGFNWGQMPDGLAGFLAIRITVKNLLLTAICLAGVAAAFRVFGLTKPASGAPLRQELFKVTKACTVAALFAIVFPLTSHGGAFTADILFYFLPAAILACLCGRLVAHACTVKMARTLAGRRDLIIVGSGPRAACLYRQLRQSNHSAVKILGFVDSPNCHVIPAEVERQMIGTLEDLEGILMQQPVDEVLIALPAKSCYAQIQMAIITCERAGVEAKYLSDIFEVSLAKPRFEAHEEASVVSLKVVHDDSRLIVKRAIDIAGAISGFVIFGPIMLAIAAAIKITSPGPALFVQERYGLRKRQFHMYKFRTMVPDAEKLQASLESQNEVQGPAFKMRNDPRVTPLGRILRKTSLDELPQFINVLRGEMSLVGPRPLPKRDVSRFDDASLMRRFCVKPGLTCLWQINGRSNTDFERWIELDLRYIDTWSLTLDLEILAKTFPSVLAGRGAA
ncbi:MAG TPA: sugar transferase [Bryobacteraceae bacterium]|jgi:exopolysaccharide biosynthesis polyprenyl glycosylphosphotransferase|nr:sugar transferase [Bryobacteraceae bacterium]